MVTYLMLWLSKNSFNLFTGIRTSFPNCYLSCCIESHDKACSRSSIKSSTFSIPTETLMSSSDIPVFSLTSFGRDAWVMIAGCSMSDSTPPRLSAKENIFTFSKNLRAASSPPFIKMLLFQQILTSVSLQAHAGDGI